MGFHGNSKRNEKEHHLYSIYDKEENDVFKYGISDKSIGEDGYSKRMREQVDYLNRAVGWTLHRRDSASRDHRQGKSTPSGG